MKEFIYILTFSLQMSGILILAEKIVFIKTKTIIKKYIKYKDFMLIKSGKAKISKENYLDIMKSMIDISFGTIYTIIGQVLTLVSDGVDIMLINKICYVISLMLLLYYIKYITKKILLFISSKKFKNLKYIDIDDDMIPDGTVAFEPQNDNLSNEEDKNVWWSYTTSFGYNKWRIFKR